MTNAMRLAGIAALTILLGCKDNSAEAYKKCVEADAKGDGPGAQTACSDAIAADPNSTNGKAAAVKLKEIVSKAKAEKEAAEAKRSLCGDLETWLPPFHKDAADLQGVLPKWKARNQAESRLKGTERNLELLQIKSDMKKETAARGADLRSRLAILKAHPLAPGEESTQRYLVMAYDTVATGFEKYAELFKSIKNIGEIVRLSEIMGDMSALATRLDTEVRAKCLSLKEGDGGVPFPYSDEQGAGGAVSANGRYRTQACGGILDTKTNLLWSIGSDRDTTWDEASSWASGLATCGGGWRLPTSGELKALYDDKSTAGTGYEADGKHFPAKIDPIFAAIGGGSWVWTDKAEDASNATAYNMFINSPVVLKKTGATRDGKIASTRGFAVRKGEGSALGSGFGGGLSDSNSPSFVRISGGSFVPGCLSDCGKQVERSVAAFEMSKTEVTQAQFREYVTATKKEPKGACWVRKRSDEEASPKAHWFFPHEGEDHPVVCVTRDEAVAYATWLSTETKTKVRLPTAIEWEWAARGGSAANAYSWGSEWPPPKGAANISDRSAAGLAYEGNEVRPLETYDDGLRYSGPVGKTAPNPFGLFDMTGNVYEWVGDECSLRGGSWDNGGGPLLKTTGTMRAPCLSRFTAAGFRVVREAMAEGR